MSSSIPPTASSPFARLLLTGAAGGLGQVLRPRLGRLAGTLRVSDIAPMAPAAAGEEAVTAALESAAEVDALVAGCDAVVHLGGISVEGPFEPILQANVVGVWNLYEAARRHGTRPVGENSRNVAHVESAANGTSRSVNGTSSWRSSSQGRSDHDE